MKEASTGDNVSLLTVDSPELVRWPQPNNKDVEYKLYLPQKKKEKKSTKEK